MGRNGHGPKWSWVEMVMGRNGHGPKWLWAEMTRNHHIPPNKLANNRQDGFLKGYRNYVSKFET